jgi:lipopolysaccharide biosynthesis glycosyltransferase
MDFKENKKAFVWLLMLGDNYLAGALTSAHSFRKYNTLADLVVMVTPDISKETRKILSEVFDKVVEVPYIEVKTKPMRTQKQSEVYNSWISKSYTKWNALSLVDYSTVCMIDADIITLKNIDEIFKLKAPAAVFKSSYTRLYDPYRNPKHGSVIKPSQIWKGLTKDSFVATAYICLLPTSMDYYAGLIKMITESQPYGFKKCFYGHDEQSISHYLSCYENGPKLPWSAIDPRYGFNIGKYQMLRKGEYPYTIHYINHPKPWCMKDVWPDLDIWWSLAKSMKVDWSKVKIDHSKLTEPSSRTCYICKTFNKNKSHNHPFSECPN